MAVALAAMQILPDFPENTSGWLSLPEQRLAQMRMIEDAGPETISEKHNGFVLALTDWKVWWLALALTALVAALSYHVYFPTLSATMGYNRTITLLLCAPPWIFASVVALLLSRQVQTEHFKHSLLICANHQALRQRTREILAYNPFIIRRLRRLFHGNADVEYTGPVHFTVGDCSP